MWRLSALFTFVLLALALAAHQLGWVDGALLLRVSAVVALVIGLMGVVRLPWDLTFQARSALARQRAAQKRGLVVDAAELTFTERSASRALWLAITLHLAGALLAAVASTVLGPELGGILAAAFLGSMALRPVHAFYIHTQRRLSVAAREAELPPPDAHALAADLAQIQAQLREIEEDREVRREALEARLSVMEAHARDEAGAWRRAIHSGDEKLDRTLLEFQRTVERAHEGAEVLAGIRAFVRLAREP